MVLACGLILQLIQVAVLVVLATLHSRHARTEELGPGNLELRRDASIKLQRGYATLALVGIGTLVLASSCLIFTSRSKSGTDVGSVAALLFVIVYFVCQRPLLNLKRASGQSRLTSKHEWFGWTLEAIDEAMTPSLRSWFIGDDGKFKPPRFLVPLVLASLIITCCVFTGITPKPTSTVVGVVENSIENAMHQSTTSRGRGAAQSGGTSSTTTTKPSSASGSQSTNSGGQQSGASADGKCNQQSMLAYLANSSIPGKTISKFFPAWLPYQGYIGCPMATSPPYTSVNHWVLPLSGDSDGPAWLVGDDAFAAVLFSADFGSMILSELPSLQSVGARYSWGFGTAQVVTATSGACQLYERYERTTPFELPAAVTSVVAQMASPYKGYPRVTPGPGTNPSSYAVVIYRPDAQSPTGALVVLRATVSYNRSLGQATSSSGPSGTDSASCLPKVASLTTYGGNLHDDVHLAPAFS
jgi:hypothetical protein